MVKGELLLRDHHRIQSSPSSSPPKTLLLINHHLTNEEQMHMIEENSFVSDDISTTSSQFIIDTMQSETERRTARAKQIRRSGDNDKLRHSKRTCNNKNKKGRKSVRTNSNTSSSSRPLQNGIMSVRTLEESLSTASEKSNWKNVVSNRRKRRVLRRRIDRVIKDVNNSRKNEGSSVTADLTGSTLRSDIPSYSESISEDDSYNCCSLSDSGSCMSAVSTEKFNVSFHNVQIREYYMVPGDNPSVSRGPPITIEWNHNYEQTHNLEHFERFRDLNRRLQSQIKMPPSIRTQILIKQGYSLKEIRDISKEATIIRRQRIKTVGLMHNDKIVEKVESVKRTLRKPFKSQKEKEERKKFEMYYKKNKKDLDTTKRTKNIKNLNDDEKERSLNESSSSNCTIEGISVMDTSRSGKKYDLIGRDQYDIDTSRTAKKYDLIPSKNNEYSRGSSKVNFISNEPKSQGMDASRTGKQTNIISEMDSSRSGSRYDLTPKSDIDSTRHGTKFDLTPRGPMDEYLNNPDVEVQPRTLEQNNFDDLLEDDESEGTVDEENTPFHCIPEGVFLLVRQYFMTNFDSIEDGKNTNCK